jgi:hypothetical protein
MNRGAPHRPGRLDRLKNVVFKLNIAAFVFLCLFAVVELVAWQVCRALVASHAQMEEPAYLAAYQYFDWTEEHLANLRNSFLVLEYEPYYLWGVTEVRSSTYNVLPDWGGIRKTVNVAKEAPARRLKVFMLGGSTAFSARVPDRCTIASYLSASLNERFEAVEFSVSNLGRGGFVSDQEIVLLTQMLTAGEVPDLVIFYDGVNETINKVCQGIPHYQYDRFLAIGMAGTEERGLLEALLDCDYVGKAARLIAGRPTDKAHYFTDRETLSANARQMADRYRRNMAFVGKLGEAYGFQAVFLWQPNLFTTGKAPTDEEADILQNDAKSAVWRPGFEVAHQVVKETMLDEEGFYDLCDVLDPIEECIFFDLCHVSSIANQAIGDRIADVLVEGGYVTGAEGAARSRE